MRLEYRGDISDQPFFTKNATETSKNQKHVYRRVHLRIHDESAVTDSAAMPVGIAALISLGFHDKILPF